MKKVYILRHAKSSWSDPSLSDIERPLNKRGKKDAPIMAEVMQRYNYVPEIIILSPSARTRATIKPVVKKFEIPEEKVFIESSLYHGYFDDFEEVIKDIEDDIGSVLMVGHNPGITYIANSCDGPIIDNVPTCGLLVIEANIDSWQKFHFTDSKLVKFHYPKMYK